METITLIFLLLVTSSLICVAFLAVFGGDKTHEKELKTLVKVLWGLIAGILFTFVIWVWMREQVKNQESEITRPSPTYVVEEILVTGSEHVKDYMEENLGVPSGKKQFLYTILLVSETNDSLVVETKLPVFMDSDDWIGQEVTVDTVKRYIQRK